MYSLQEYWADFDACNEAYKDTFFAHNEGTPARNSSWRNQLQLEEALVQIDAVCIMLKERSNSIKGIQFYESTKLELYNVILLKPTMNEKSHLLEYKIRLSSKMKNWDNRLITIQPRMQMKKLSAD